jgi:hypothetical protein
MFDHTDAFPCDEALMNAITVTLAHWLAVKEIKRQLLSMKVKLSHCKHADIVSAARDYLRDHPELLDQAAEYIRKSPELTKMAAREERYRNPSRGRRL